MRRVAIPLLSAVLAPWLAVSTVHATCFCMLRPPPQDRVGSSITSDPSYNPAAAVFLVRDGTRTIMTIEAAYRGPVTEISMVIPVPHPIERGDVRTVSGTVFRRLDRRTAPKVQHVWPACTRLRRSAAPRASGAGAMDSASEAAAEPTPEDLGVEIEDEWEVEEYDVTTLGAAQSTGLLEFLRLRGLELSAEAEPALRAYIETGHRFVLVKADPARANRVGEDMVLSPIQLDYESEELRVPVRLGTLNSPGEQELLLYVLSTDGRYEIANRPNVLAPTDVRLSPSWRGGMAALYSGLMEEAFRQTPGAGVTEYARDLGRGVSTRHVRDLGLDRVGADTGISTRRGRGGGGAPARQWTLTRIRHRYGKDLTDDIVLRHAEPTRLTRRWGMGIDSWAPAGRNNFQTRFVVVHRGASCPDEAVQRRRARTYATSDEMWRTEAPIWPGTALMDPIDSLGISPGSSPPPGFGTRPPMGSPSAGATGGAGAPEAGAAPATASTMTGAAIPMPIAPAPVAQPAPVPAPAAGAASDDGLFGCAAGGDGRGLGALVMIAFAFVIMRVRRRARMRGRER